MTTPKNRTVEAGGDDPREFVVVLRGVSRFFNNYQLRALTDVTFAARRGEVFGLLGPKGSGKSTALRIIAGRLHPTEGIATAFDRSPRRSSIKSRISYLADVAGESAATGWAGFFRRFFPRKPIRPDESAASDPGTLRRAQLTHALARNADLLVLDEPFAGLDSATLREVKELILTIAQRGTTVILSGDSLSDTRDVCDRLAILYEGKIQAIGTLDQLLAAPDAIRFTAPILPATITDRVLKVIREEIGGNAQQEDSAPENSRNASADAASKIPQAEPAATATATESILTPLLKAHSPALQPASAAESGKAAVDSVNHRKLAELTKPAAPST